MKIVLKTLKIRSFKKIPDLTLNFSAGLNMLIGRNGSGKSSVLDAITWCLFGKDFTDRKKFYLMPLNSDQTEQIAIPGVSITLMVDDDEYTLLREVEDGVTSCYINTAPKLVKEYQDFVGKLFGNEDRFKMFSMPLFFPEHLEWKEQRALFMQFFPDPEPGVVYARMMADKINFDQELVHSLKSMTPADYIRIHEKALKESETEKLKIDAQIELLDKQLEGQHDQNLDDLAEEREQLRREMSEYTEQLQETNSYNSKIAKVENELQRQRTALVNKKTDLIYQIESTYNRERGHLENLLNMATAKLADCRQQFIQAQQQEIKETCPVCKQPMPDDMIGETIQHHHDTLKRISDDGNAAKATIADLETRISQLKKGEIPAEIDQQIAEIDVKLGKQPAKKEPPELDEKIYTRLQEIEKALARSDVHAENQKLRDQAEAKERQINSEAERHTIAIKDAGYFIQYQSKIVVERINQEFKNISVKIFEQQKNGVTKETFEITSNGVPYSGLNCTGQLQAGLELISFLKAHLKIEVPVIIDNGERYTDLDMNSIPGQKIVAMAKRGSQLKLEVQ